LDADFVKIKFPPEIQACIDKGNIYDFNTTACSPLPQKTSFECTFDGVKTAMAAIGIGGAAIDQAVSQKAKLIACSQKRAGLSIITQWWYPTSEELDKQSCTFNGTMTISTGCFQKENGDGTVTTGSTPEEKAEIIKKCLQ
jgi:hypothetical protein